MPLSNEVVEGITGVMTLESELGAGRIGGLRLHDR